jgi:large subunit ribosomal protein L9
MAKNIKLMLTENVDSLGIVGDVVNVRVGYARNFLMPRAMATEPSDEAIAAVAAKRAEAQRMVAEQRKQREELVHKLEGIHLNMVRSCNDLGHLYASVTQQEIAAALAGEGYPGIRPRDVRLNVNVKRVDTYDIPIKFEQDLEAHIKLTVQPDRKLDLDRRHEPEAAPAEAAEGAEAHTEGGALPETAPAEKPRKKKEGKPAADKGEAGERPEKGEKSEKAEKPEKAEKGEKHAKKGKGEKGDKGEGKAEEKKGGGGWGTPVSKPEGLDFLGQKRERRGRR